MRGKQWYWIYKYDLSNYYNPEKSFRYVGKGKKVPISKHELYRDTVLNTLTRDKKKLDLLLTTTIGGLKIDVSAVKRSLFAKKYMTFRQQYLDSWAARFEEARKVQNGREFTLTFRDQDALRSKEYFKAKLKRRLMVLRLKSKLCRANQKSRSGRDVKMHYAQLITILKTRNNQYWKPLTALYVKNRLRKFNETETVNLKKLIVANKNRTSHQSQLLSKKALATLMENNKSTQELIRQARIKALRDAATVARCKHLKGADGTKSDKYSRGKDHNMRLSMQRLKNKMLARKIASKVSKQALARGVEPQLVLQEWKVKLSAREGKQINKVQCKASKVLGLGAIKEGHRAGLKSKIHL